MCCVCGTCPGIARISLVKSPSLDELPPPPRGFRGWPWTEACECVGHDDNQTGTWPRLSIVTPSFSQGRFIEETIRSVLLQGYPDIEYVVIDGGSADESCEVIAKYSPWLTYWVSEPDRGQAHAINKGLSRCTGDIVAYINSDDAYLKNAFAKAANVFRTDPSCTWLVGACYVIRDRDNPQWCDIPRFTDDLEAWYDRRCGLPQPSTFLSHELVRRHGGFEEGLSYAFDHEYWIRLIIAGHKPTLLPSALAAFKLHDAAKTSTGPCNFRSDLYRIEEMHQERLQPLIRARLMNSRSIRRWGTEIRDGLELCAEGRWRTGSELLFKSAFDRRLLLAVFRQPGVLAHILRSVCRRLPSHLYRSARSAAQRLKRSDGGGAPLFKDPLGEYNLWTESSHDSG